MTQPIISTTQPSSVFTVGQQGPPGVGVAFAALSIVTFAQSGLSMTSGGFYPVDTRGGVVTLNTPGAVDGALFGVSDLYANAPVNPIVLQATGVAVTIGDPSNPGTFSATVHIASPGGRTAWFAFNVLSNLWIPVWW